MYEYNYKLVRVVDGDTVDIDIDLGFGTWLRNQRVRLMGIDTPECRTRDDEEKKFGLLAKEKLQQLLANSRVVKTFKDEKGKFGRVLGDFEVYYQDRWCGVVEVLIKEHYGVKYHGQGKEKIAEDHLENRIWFAERLMEQGVGNST